MRIVWDEPKRQANLSKHRLDFADLDKTFFDDALFPPSYGGRWRAIGETIQGVISVVFVTLAGKPSAMRPASRYERKLHAER